MIFFINLLLTQFLLESVVNVFFRPDRVELAFFSFSILPFTVSYCPATDISVLSSEIYCTYHVTDSTRTAARFCHCWSVRPEQSPCLWRERHWSCFQAPAKDFSSHSTSTCSGDALYISTVDTLTSTFPLLVYFHFFCKKNLHIRPYGLGT